MTDASLPISPTPVEAPAAKAIPSYPEGADLLVRTAPHDEQFWDRHPAVERYRVVITPERVDDPQWQVLIWLKPTLAQGLETPEASPPERPADLDLAFDSAHDAELLSGHPDVVARQADLQLNEHATGSERRVRLWLRDGTSGRD